MNMLGCLFPRFVNSRPCLCVWAKPVHLLCESGCVSFHTEVNQKRCCIFFQLSLIRTRPQQRSSCLNKADGWPWEDSRNCVGKHCSEEGQTMNTCCLHWRSSAALEKEEKPQYRYARIPKKSLQRKICKAIWQFPGCDRNLALQSFIQCTQEIFIRGPSKRKSGSAFFFLRFTAFKYFQNIRRTKLTKSFQKRFCVRSLINND